MVISLYSSVINGVNRTIMFVTDDSLARYVIKPEELGEVLEVGSSRGVGYWFEATDQAMSRLAVGSSDRFRINEPSGEAGRLAFRDNGNMKL